MYSSQCLKITEKVAFNIASEASYVYILSGHKFIKNAKNWSILVTFTKPEMRHFWVIFKHCDYVFTVFGCMYCLGSGFDQHRNSFGIQCYSSTPIR